MTTKSLPKIAFIIDKSAAYRAFQRDLLLESWGIEKKNTQVSDSLGNASASSLFGESLSTMVTVSSTEHAKELASQLSSLSPEEFARISDAGLIFITDLMRTQTKALEAAVTKVGGRLLTPPGKKEETVAEKLLSFLHLNSQTKRFLLDYVGEEYETLIPLIQSIQNLPPKMQQMIKEEDILIRMPQPPGSVPFWDIQKPILQGDLPKALELARRIQPHSGYIPWLVLLKNKLLTYYELSSLLETNPKMTEDEIKKIISFKGNLYYLKKEIAGVSSETFLQALQEAAKAEGMVKGGSSAPSVAVTEVLLVKLCSLFKRRGR